MPSAPTLALTHPILQKLEDCAANDYNVFQGIVRRLDAGTPWPELAQFLIDNRIVDIDQKRLIDDNYQDVLGRLCQGFLDAYRHVTPYDRPRLRHAMLTGMADGGAVSHMTLPGLVVVVIFVPAAVIESGFGPYGKLTNKRDMGFVGHVHELRQYIEQLLGQPPSP